MKESEVARNVRVKLNSNWNSYSLGDEYLKEEPIIFISDNYVYNDVRGKYVYIKGGSMINLGTAYLTELDLEFPIGETPLYNWEDIKFGEK